MKRNRLLVVDDEIAFTKILKLNLEQNTDCDVRIVNRPTDAIHAVFEFEPDLILLDVMMPELDGGDIAARLRDSPRFSKVPIIFLTAAASRREIAQNHGTIGGHEFLAKPVDLAELLACIRKHLAPPQPPHAPGLAGEGI